jgi:hypothetical protein
MQRQALEILIRSKAGTQSGNVEEGAVGFRNTIKIWILVWPVERRVH